MIGRHALLSWRYETWREGPVCRVSRAFIAINSIVTGNFRPWWDVSQATE